MTIRKLLVEDAAVFQALRLRALLDRPESFTSSHAEESHLTIEEVAARLAPTLDRAVFGAFVDGRLIGIAGLGREQMQKIAHKAYIWGMYVESSYRKQGWGRQLLATAIEFAAQIPGVRQVSISVYGGNDVARRLYLSSDFVAYGVEPCAMRIGDTCYDEEHMVLMLRQPTR